MLGYFLPYISLSARGGRKPPSHSLFHSNIPIQYSNTVFQSNIKSLLIIGDVSRIYCESAGREESWIGKYVVITSEIVIFIPYQAIE